MNILERSEHGISRQSFSEPALKVMYRLHNKGHRAYLVGGALRDIFREKQPRDFDIVTDAEIPEIRQIFRNSRAVGKRFPIVHTYFGDDLIEISSLKGEEVAETDTLALIHEDAKRRDFTVNALYYDIENFKIYDPLNGLEDIRTGQLRCVGEANVRFAEDPVRMLRALKLKVKHGFKLEDSMQEAIRRQRHMARGIGAGRRYEEVTRIFLDEQVERLLETLQETGLLGHFWPVGSMLVDEKGPKQFSKLRDLVPIRHSRGSFAKESHLLLWFRLFLEAGVFDPRHNPPNQAKAQFTRFAEPLGHPFKHPILDALHAITLMCHQHGRHAEAFALHHDVYNLVDHYVQHFDESLKPQFKTLLKQAHQTPSPMAEPKHADQGQSVRSDGKRRRRGGKRRRQRSSQAPDA